VVLYELIKQLLTDYPSLRDSDKKLIWSVHIKEGKVMGGKISMEDFLSSTSEESITRARRRVQEEHPELCASPLIQEMRDKKEEDKGTFIYHEQVNLREPLTIPIEAKTGLLKYRKILEEKGVLRPKKDLTIDK